MSWKTQILLLPVWARAIRDEPERKRVSRPISFETLLARHANCLCLSSEYNPTPQISELISRVKRNNHKSKNQESDKEVTPVFLEAEL